MNFVYLSTNLVNGKQYVGSHEGDENDSYLGSGKLINKAIQKYGSENFERKILEICNPSDNLILESKYIEKFNTLIPNGYNLSPTGGFGNNGGKHNEETKKKISEKVAGENHPNFGKPSPMSGKKHSPETKEKISKNRKGKPAWNKGKKFSKETKKKISEKVAGENHPNFGKHLSKDTKKKIRNSQIGQKRGPRSEETKKKISEYWRKKREEKEK